MDLTHLEHLCRDKITTTLTSVDPAHDLAHVERVVKTARELATAEGARLAVVIPAAWLHDLINVAKNDPRRALASKMSADAASEFLNGIGYPSEWLPDVRHAIHAHSFSARVAIESTEAAVVQDADRLDGLGAIGVARVFATAGILGRPFYANEDPFCRTRPPDDARFTIDHFFAKLFKTAATLNTTAGRAEGERRVARMRAYLADLAREI